MRKLLLLLLCLAFTQAWAQVQSPKEFLGYELGERFTRHHRVVEYYQHVAANSSKVVLKEYGRTFEDRPLVYAIVTSEANHQNIETIRTDNLKRAGLQNGSPSTNVPIIWLSYNVHGNESVSMEASMATIYELVTNKSAWLEEGVVIMDPCINPDGRDRYANYYNQYGNKDYNPDPQSKEHNEVWPGGRANHYLFDLNRDWAWQTQIESKKRIAVYNQWMPQIHVDFHEQGVNSPYYMAPAAKPYHELITKWQYDFQVTIGKNNAKYFDQNGWLYFTKERFDLLYPSYGDTYPVYNGAIGMTYEQGGGGRGGLGVLTAEGDTLTLKDRIAHHHSNGVSTVEVTVAHKSQVLQEYQKFFSNNVNSFPGKYKGFVIKGDNNPDKLTALANWLDAMGIAYGTGAAGKPLKGFNYQTQATESFNLTSSDLVVSNYQPRGVLASILFEPSTYVEDSNTYDITAWGVPYAKGLKAYAVSEKITPGTGKYSAPSAEVTSADKAYAYIARWQTLEDAKFLAQLLKNKVKVRYAETPFSIGGKNYERGTLIITRRGNEQHASRFDGLVKGLAKEYGRSLDATTTGFVDSGKDFGSGDVHYIDAPKVAVLAGNGVSSLAYGETWHFFERQLDYPISVLDTDDFSRFDLSGYDVIIIQNGRYNGLGDGSMKMIDEWVRNGGRLILVQGALNSFADRDGYSLKRYADDDEKAALKKLKEKWEEADASVKYADRERNYIQGIIPGAIYKVSLDNTHPLAYGYGNSYFSLKTAESRFGKLSGAWNVAYIPSGAKPVSGFAGNRVQKELENSLVFGVDRMGGGQVIYMSDNPLFRAFWDNGKLLFANAVFFVGQ
ncbi:MAG: M14 family zinc carboxypeptidase [Imperialibacter sp.]|uniref:M14 family zinc carboxypeptidase n=1 Tax=Imperialibacter sp. TaxID=2038411 RepID=UPI0032EAED0C